MARTINFKMTKENGFKLDYECEGFEGTACENVADIMANLGNVSEKKANEDAHQYEIPIPVPNQIQEG